MSRGIAAFAFLAIALGAVFVRLGIWQLDRLGERRVQNAHVLERLAEPERPLETLGDTGGAYRAVVVDGEVDYEHEFVVAGRSRNGSPGVHILTPIRVGTDERRYLINRGWVYSPDAATVDLSRWRESRRRFTGYSQVLVYDVDRPIRPATPRRTRRLTTGNVAGLLPYRAYSVYMVAQDSTTDATPARLPPPDLSEGPHFNYAIQWFAFAIIAVVGAGIVVERDRRRRRDAEARAQGLP